MLIKNAKLFMASALILILFLFQSCATFLTDKPSSDAVSEDRKTYQNQDHAYIKDSKEEIEYENISDPESLEIISNYLNSLTYMVYYNEEKDVEPFLIKTALKSANSFLAANGYEYIDTEQIEKIKTEQQNIYKKETGGAVSILQWIAHKTSADIYIEISLSASSSKKNGKYYGTANVEFNCYNALNAEKRGSADYVTDSPVLSTISSSDALSNAVESAVFNGMPEALAEAEKQTVRAVSKGFKYSVHILNTEDLKVIQSFQKKLGSRVKRIKRISYSPEETVFEVYIIGDIYALEDLIYGTVKDLPGFENFLLVMQRGNSITFDTGI